MNPGSEDAQQQAILAAITDHLPEGSSADFLPRGEIRVGSEVLHDIRLLTASTSTERIHISCEDDECFLVVRAPLEALSADELATVIDTERVVELPEEAGSDVIAASPIGPAGREPEGFDFEEWITSWREFEEAGRGNA